MYEAEPAGGGGGGPLNVGGPGAGPLGAGYRAGAWGASGVKNGEFTEDWAGTSGVFTAVGDSTEEE